MSEKKINLDELYRKGKGSNVNISKAQFKKTVLKFGKQLLELAAENAEMILLIDEENDIVEEASIDKQSILDTIKQIK